MDQQTRYQIEVRVVFFPLFICLDKSGFKIKFLPPFLTPQCRTELSRTPRVHRRASSMQCAPNAEAGHAEQGEELREGKQKTADRKDRSRGGCKEGNFQMKRQCARTEKATQRQREKHTKWKGLGKTYMERKRAWGKRPFARQNSEVLKKVFGSEAESRDRALAAGRRVAVPLLRLRGLHCPPQVSHQLWGDSKSDTGMGGHPADAVTCMQLLSVGRCSAPICPPGRAVPSAAHTGEEGGSTNGSCVPMSI